MTREARSGSYHHGDLRRALAETGLELARTSGADGVALRKVARRVGVSHNAAYRHFADREALLAEIGALAMERLTTAMQAEVGRVSDVDPVAGARERLKATGRAYVAFALAEPGLFGVAFSMKAESPPTDVGPYGILNEVLDELVSVGYLAPERRPGSDVACWAAVHGFSALCLDGPLGPMPSDLRSAALERLLDTVDRGLG